MYFLTFLMYLPLVAEICGLIILGTCLVRYLRHQPQNKRLLIWGCCCLAAPIAIRVCVSLVAWLSLLFNIL